MRSSGAVPVAVNPDLDAYLAERDELLHEELSKVARMLPKGELPGVSLENGELKVSRLKKDEPDGLDDFRRRLYSYLGRIRKDLVALETSVAARREHGEGFQERVLTDGSRHSIYRKYFSPEDLSRELGNARVLFSGDHFVLVSSPG